MAREYPQHPLPSCHALIRKGDQLLLVQRAKPPFQGHWSLPGGGVELGETIEEALVREVKEETGLDVTVSQFLGYRNAIDRDDTGRVRLHYVVLYLEAQVAGGVLTPADDAADARWVSVADIPSLPVTDAVEACLRWSRQR